MDIYQYVVDIAYVVPAENKIYKFREETVRSIVIDRDFTNNNMPIIYLTMVVDKNMLDRMTLNSQKNLINLTIYKQKKGLSSSIKTVYVKEQFIYFLLKDVNYNMKLDYGAAENFEREDIYRIVTMGLLKKDSVVKNKTTINTVFSNTTMTNALVHLTKPFGPVIIEPLTYNETLTQIIIPPTPTIAQTISYLNQIRVFYATPYRFFIDYNTTYILSSAGVKVPKMGSTINSILVVVRNVENYNSQIQGMLTDGKQKIHQIDVSSTDTQVSTNIVTEKSYNTLLTTTSTGTNAVTDVDINKSEYLSKMNKFVQLPNDNVNMSKNLRAQTESKRMHFTCSKNDLNASIFTPNMEYIIKNYDKYSERNGLFLITREREIFYREDKFFVNNTTLDLDFLAPVGSSGVKT